MKKKKILKVVSLMTAATACVAAGAFALNVSTAKAETEDVFHELGASVRVSTDKGIRFAFGLPADKTGKDYEIGTLVIPKDILGEAELNHNSDTVDAEVVDYQIIPCNRKWVDKSLIKSETKDGYNYYNAALTDIPELHYNTVLVARSYYKDSEGNYVYSDSVERSIGYVASAALNDGYEDTKNILADIVKEGYGETALTVEGGEELLSVADASTLTASNEKGYLPVWSSSNPNVATVDKTGKVTAVKGGETTITATIGNVTAEKTIYSVGAGLYADDIGMRVNGYNMTNNASYMSMNIGENGEMIIGAKFQASWENYYAGLIWRNIESKEYYQALVDNGYKYITFDLKVDGEDKDKVSDLYVFCGQKLTSFEQVNGVYKVKMLVSDIVRVYDRVQTFLPGDTDRIGQIGSAAGMLLAWRDNRDTDKGMERNYVFTISNPKFTIPTLEVDFAEDNTDLIEVGKTTTLTAQTNVGGEITWSSSDATIATVENGVVTGVKGGEVTITATSADGLTESETVYVVGGLNSNQIGIRVNGTDVSSNQNYFTMATDASVKMTITANMTADATYYPALILKNIFDKTYYQKLIASGYTKLTFMLGVGGTNAADVSDLYVLGSKKLTSFPKNANGEYAVTVSVDTIVNYYDTMYTIATSSNKVGQTSSMPAKFITWQSPASDYSTVRNYVFTISNMGFRQGVLFSDNLGMRVNGYNVTGNTSYMTMDIGANGEMIIGANFQASWDPYHAGLVWNNIEKATYESLIAQGYTYLTFDLKVEGTDADKVSDLYMFCGQQLSSITQEDGIYKVKILLSDIPRVFDAISTYFPSDERKGQTGSRHGMFLAWRDNRGTDRGTWRNYVFTISNTAYAK